MLDATLGFISIEQNEIVKTLTIASVVGIPPVFAGHAVEQRRKELVAPAVVEEVRECLVASFE